MRPVLSSSPLARPALYTHLNLRHLPLSTRQAILHEARDDGNNSNRISRSVFHEFCLLCSRSLARLPVWSAKANERWNVYTLKAGRQAGSSPLLLLLLERIYDFGHFLWHISFSLSRVFHCVDGSLENRRSQGKGWAGREIRHLLLFGNLEKYSTTI